METMIVILALLLLTMPIVAIVALVKVVALQDVVRRLTIQVEALSRGRSQEFVTPAAAIGPSNTEAAEQSDLSFTAEQQPSAADSSSAESEAEPEPAAKPAPQPDFAPPPRNVEQALASRWLVWLGGAAIALGGVFLVKYAHDNQLIPPVVRVLFGLLAGTALVAAGEWLRLRRGEGVKDFVPAALSAAGLVIAFGVSYAAYALYNIVAPAVCFPLLALISLFALWLSLRQGPFIAALGLVGATLTPALIASDDPSAAGFFAYLLVIVAASLAVLRKRDWWWLGYAALAAGSIWALLWLHDFGAGSMLAIGIFALAMGTAAIWVPRGRDILDESHGSLWTAQAVSPQLGIAIAGCTAMTVLLSALVMRSGHAQTALVLFTIGMAAITAFGWLRKGLVLAPVLAAAVTLAVLLAWRDVGFHAWAFDERGYWVTVPGLIEPPRFRTAMVLAGAVFTVIGILGVLRKTETRPWAILAAGAGFVFVFAAWSRADFSLAWHSWVALAAVFASALAFGVHSLHSDLSEETKARSIEILMIGCTGLLIFALDRMLDGVWLTLAVGLVAAALAYFTRSTPLPNIAGIAAMVAGFAAVRLFLGREFWSEPTNLPLGAHWVLYGYGVPAALFWQASRWLNRTGFERWQVAFEGLSLGLLISLVSLEIRVLIGGGITSDDVGLLELAAHACAWLGAAYGLAFRQQLFSSFVSKWGALALLGAATLAFVLALTVRNPVITGDALQGGRIFNALWLAYLAPVPIYALIARKLDGLGLARWRSAFGVFALVLLMTFVTLIVKRQFQTAEMGLAFLSQGESYAVSLVWLVTGIGIFIAGLRIDRQSIRYGGLAVLVLTVLKVFGYDLFLLGGLWRIASMIGLGLCLVGVGWLYTRYVGSQAAKPSQV